MQDQLEIFHRPARHQLAAAYVQRLHPCAGFATILRQQCFHLLGPACPFAPVTLAGQLGLQRVIRKHLATCQINAHHLARPNAATLDDAIFGYDNHAGFRSGDHQPVICHDIAHRAQAVPVQPGNDPVIGIGGNGCRPVPRFHHRIAIGIKLGKITVTADIDRCRDHHGLHHWQCSPAMTHQFKHRIKGGGIRAAFCNNRL